MTHWIDERLAEVRAREDRENKIRNNATAILDALWECLVADIAFANQTELGEKQVQTAGNNATRELQIVRHHVPRAQSQAVSIRLTRDLHTIEVAGGPFLFFRIGVSDDGTVGLFDQGGDRVELAEASRRILEPFLFPDLHRPQENHCSTTPGVCKTIKDCVFEARK
jgi:hypothetical protein